MKSNRLWNHVFHFKAVYNWLTPVLVLFLIPPQGDRLYFHLFLALAFVFGFGYWWAGNDPINNRKIIFMGVAGQGAVFVISFLHGLGRPIDFETIAQTGAGLVDGTFSVLFAVFLYQARKVRANPAHSIANLEKGEI